MKQLDEIVDLAASDDARLVTILRKCLVVATRLKNDRLREWVTAELNGYKDHLMMPDYRITAITAKGFFIGPFQAQINDQPLPSGFLKKEHRWWATTGYLKESISAYEAMTSGAEKHDTAILNWPPDLVVHYQSKFFQGYTLNRAWQEIPIGSVIAVVDAVRTRLLQFALEMQSEVGSNDNTIPDPEIVERTVQNIIYGGTNFVGHVTGSIKIIGNQLVFKDDFGSLQKALEEIGINNAQIDELKQAIEADLGEGAELGFGRRVASWLQKAGTYVGKEGLKAGLEVAQKAANHAVLAYFGLTI